MQILFGCYRDSIAIYYTSPEADIGLHTDGIRAMILCAGFLCVFSKYTVLLVLTIQYCQAPPQFQLQIPK